MPNSDGAEAKGEMLQYVYNLLKENRQPIHYSALMEEVAKEFFGPEHDLVQAKARFYTWLNLDTRFSNMGRGLWGLRNWAPQRRSSSIPVLTLMHKTVEYDDAASASDSEPAEEEPFTSPDSIPEDEEGEEPLDDDLTDEQDDLGDEE